MFLFWLLLALAIGIGENIKDSYDAYKYHQTPEYQRELSRFRSLNDNK